MRQVIVIVREPTPPSQMLQLPTHQNTPVKPRPLYLMSSTSCDVFQSYHRLYLHALLEHTQDIIAHPAQIPSIRLHNLLHLYITSINKANHTLPQRLHAFESGAGECNEAVWLVDQVVEQDAYSHVWMSLAEVDGEEVGGYVALL